MADDHFLTDVQWYGPPNKAMAEILLSPSLGAFMQVQAEKVALLYAAKVAKRSGKLAASATPSVEIGGHKSDRLVGKVTIGGEGPVSVWHSERNPNANGEFYYGVLHDLGGKNRPDEFPAHKDLREALRES